MDIRYRLIEFDLLDKTYRGNVFLEKSFLGDICLLIVIVMDKIAK